MAQHSPREILVFVAGSTPQIITETIQALAFKTPPIHLNELHIITTLAGKKRIRQKLVEEGILDRLCEEWGLPPIPLPDEALIVISDRNGNPLDDIRTSEENELAGDQIAELLRRLTSEPGTRLHCSLAGGRKTMSYYMGAAFQLFARQWDRLYHVLISSEFETNDQFYYKPRQNRTLTIRSHDGATRQVNTDDARIELTELPLIYLRDKLPLSGHGVRELVSEGQASIDSASVQLPLTINLRERTIYIGKTLIELKPRELATYVAFLQLKLRHCRNQDASICGECSACFATLNEMASEPLIRLIADNYQAIYNGDATKREDMLAKWLSNIEPSTNLRQQISKINKAIEEELQDGPLFALYKVDANRKYGGSRYGVRMERGKIVIG